MLLIFVVLLLLFFFQLLKIYLKILEGCEERRFADSRGGRRGGRVVPVSLRPLGRRLRAAESLRRKGDRAGGG